LLPTDQKTGKPTWRPYQSTIATATVVDAWGRKAKAFAAVCGEVSGGLLCLDFDADGVYERWRDEVGDER
jgi:hypothetical protein